MRKKHVLVVEWSNKYQFMDLEKKHKFRNSMIQSTITRTHLQIL